MKKKTIISCLVGAAVICSVPACTNLDEKVYDKLPADTFGKTKVEVNALIGSVYNTLKVYFSGGNYLALDEMGGSSAVTPTRKGGDWYDGGQYREIYMHTYTAQTSCVKNAWTNASESIGRCNATLLALSKTEVLTEEERTTRMVEVRGVRAFWYYKLVDDFGNVPLVTDYGNRDLPTTKTRQEVFDWLIQEVNAIKDLCPERKDNYGKFTQGAAYTLLAKLLLNAEAWGVNYSGNAYGEVVDACNKVMGMGYALESNWKDNFCLTNEKSNEAILAAVFSSSDTDDRNQLMNRTLHYKDHLALGIKASGTWNGVCAQPGYVKLFDTEDPRYAGTYLIGLMIDRSTGKPVITDHGFELNHTVDVTMIPNTEYDGTTWGAVNQHDGARCQKWEFATDLTDAMENDFHIFRLADVYLMKAEALIRGNGDAAEATRCVNAVRQRAYGDKVHDYATVGLKEIQAERRYELAWELYSRQDDIRFGCYEQGMWPESNCTRSTDVHYRLYPVSQDAWQTNPNLVQNPGYPKFSE
ncbi:RagB/SusD family nutrient uptake outer membrane protein [Phocaeicola abscessus]|uniref:RagB/SusD family nutrient uptake outer membrane protein n=1 Tax=Phocaeicola abscessus TaxID=555313 RepID=UPI0028EA016D|nr:RagB/SusD family nutrient uptake outer membrane protein [Phocaeicola abscessus]